MDSSPQPIPPAPPAPLVEPPYARYRRRLAPWWLQLGAVIIGVGPLYAMVFLSGLQMLEAGKFSLTARDLLLNLAVMGVFGIFLLALLLVLGERPADLQLKRGRVGTDLLQGIGVFFGILGTVVVVRLLTAALSGNIDVPDSSVDIGNSIARNPLLLALFFGPVIWIQAAVVEELTRVFVLTRLWHIWPAPKARLICVIGWSLIFGLAHVYEGASGVVGTAAIGLLLGLAYLRYGRVLPLIIGHGLYDTAAGLAIVYAARHPEILKAAVL